MILSLRSPTENYWPKNMAAIKRNAVLEDIGTEGRMATGVELLGTPTTKILHSKILRPILRVQHRWPFVLRFRCPQEPHCANVTPCFSAQVIPRSVSQ